MNEHEEWPDLAPLDGTPYACPAPFPIDALPPVMGAFARALADCHLTPVDMPATMLLGAVSAAIAGRVVVRITPDWTEPANVYLLSVSEPSTLKSQTIKEAIAPIAQFERERVLAWKAECADLEKLIAETKEQKEEQNELKLQLKRKQEECPQMLAEDVTSERLAELLVNPIAIMSAEGKVFELICGSYKSGASDPDIHLKAWSGDAIRVDRLGNGRRHLHVDRPVLTMCLAVQPAALRLLSDPKRPELQGRGLIARFLTSYPKSRVGTRDWSTVKHVEPSAREHWAARVRELLSLPIPHPDDPMGVVTLSREAKGLLDAYRQENEDSMRPDGDLDEQKELGGKLHGHLARLALILHMADHGASGVTNRIPISENTMLAAIVLVTYFERHTLATWGALASNPRVAAAVEWLEKRAAKASPDSRVMFTTRDLLRGPRIFRSEKMPDVRALCIELAELGYVRADGRDAWLVSPRLSPDVTGVAPDVVTPEVPDVPSESGKKGALSPLSPGGDVYLHDECFQ